MSMLAFYGDDSGTDPKNRVAVVAGYVGQVVQRERFQREWKVVLEDFKVKQMRRADLEAFQGEFKRNLGWNEERRQQFLQALYPIIKSRTKIPIGGAVIKDDFDSVIPTDIKAMFGGVYGWCVHECIVAFRKWCDQRDYRHPIHWVFEAGTSGSGQVSKMFTEFLNDTEKRDTWHVKGWAFEDKSTVPLQAADVLAYEVFKQVENQIVDRGEKHAVRLSLQHLMHATDVTYLQYWGKERLTEWLDSWKKRKPPSLGSGLNHTS